MQIADFQTFNMHRTQPRLIGAAEGLFQRFFLWERRRTLTGFTLPDANLHLCFVLVSLWGFPNQRLQIKSYLAPLQLMLNMLAD